MAQFDLYSICGGIKSELLFGGVGGRYKFLILVGGVGVCVCGGGRSINSHFCWKGGGGLILGIAHLYIESLVFIGKKVDNNRHG